MRTGPGYSDTPLTKKLGIKEGNHVLLIGAPNGYEQWLQPLPASVMFVNHADASVDVAHLFVTERSA